MGHLLRILIVVLILTAPAAAAQSYIYVAVAPPPCGAGGCPPGQLLVFDAVTRQLVTSADLGSATDRPVGMAISPDGRRLYVSILTEGGASLAIFDTAHHVMGPTVSLSPAAAGAVAVTRDSERVFVAGSRLIVWDSEVGAVTAEQDAVYHDLLTHPTLDRVIAGRTQSAFGPLLNLFALDETTGATLAFKNAGFGSRLTMASDGTRFYDSMPATFIKPSHGGRVAIYDPRTLESIGTLRSCPPCFPTLAFDAPGRSHLYVMQDTGTLDAVDRTTETSVTSVNVGYRAKTAVVSADGRRAWVGAEKVPMPAGFPDAGTNLLTVVDLESFAVAGTVPLATTPLLLAATPPGATRCAYSVNTTQSSWSRAGGVAQITLTTSCGWRATTSGADWLHVTPDATAGLGARTFNVTVDPFLFPAPGGATTRTATLTIGGQVVTFTQAGFGSQAPFGVIDTPADNVSGVTGSLSVTGWVLDDVGASRVRITRDPVAAEPPGEIYLGDATFVEGARPDVQAAYGSLPYASRAGWGYLLLTNMLPGGGTGTYRLHAYADDVEGQTTLLGSRTISTANSTATVPFGAIDTPGQGEVVSGVITNWGWALTPQPASIPADGSTIDVLIDGVVVGHPTYNLHRPDVASLFPGYANSAGAVGYFTIDTRTLTNGIHTIAWVVRDSSGGVTGVGSRYFHVANP